MVIHSQEKSNAKVNLTFKNNKVKSMEVHNVITETVSEGDFVGLKGFHLNEGSSGNSLAELNY